MTEKTKNIYDEVKKIIDPLYLVGGSIRDVLLGIEPKDYDFCTPYLPEEIEQKIRDVKRRPYLTGKRFGTLGVKIDGQLIEITTFRTEVYEKNNRKPKVEFVKDISIDLSRRDFGINAIAWRDGKLIDPFGGRLDILERKIRAVGNASHRIKEDPLRMLRCARFISQFGFEVDHYLECTIKKYSYKILHISKERWMQELDKLLLGKEPLIALDFLMETKLLNYMIPELSLQDGYDQNSPYHKYNLWKHTLKVVDATPKDINLRWAALLHDIAKPFVRTDKKDRSNYIRHDFLGGEIIEKTARYLKWSNERREKVKELVVNHLAIGNVLRKYDNEGK